MKRGFTLVELLIAMTLLGIMMVVSFVSFHSTMNAYRRSTEMADRIQRADYALTQVVSALRSAWYPTSGKQDDSFGFQLYDNGDGEDPESSDMIQWTKIGTAIVGNKSTLSETPHTVRLWVEDGKKDKDRPTGLWVKAGRLDLQEDDSDLDFEDDEQFEPYPVVTGIKGFNCRVMQKDDSYETEGKTEMPKWEDEWSTSNAIPYRVELTFTLEPTDEDSEGVKIRRVVEIPLWYISQNPISSGSDKDKDSKSGTGHGGTSGGGKSSGGKGGGGKSSGGAMTGGGAPGGAAGGGAGGPM